MYITARSFMMAMMMGLIIFMCLFPKAHAQQACPPTGPVAPTDALLCWTNATLDVNNNPLPATGPGAITQTRVQRSVGANCATNFGTVAETLNVTPDVTMMFFQNLPVGRSCFRARHVSRDAANVELLSDWSPTVTKLIAAPVSRARPLTITIY